METTMSNLWNIVRFIVEDVVLERRLVPEVTDLSSEINAHSPVGRVLISAKPGDELTARAPGGDVRVKVLAITVGPT